MSFHSIPVKRLLGFWFALFFCAYLSNLLLYTVYQISTSAIIFILLQATTPLLYLLFSWLYFRRVPENDWNVRLVVAAAWVALTLLGTAILMSPVYGYPWTAAFTAGIFQGQLINMAAVLVGGWAARRG